MTRRLVTGAHLLAAVGWLTACSTLTSRGDEPQGDHLLLSHERHIEMEISCYACHYRTMEADDLSGSLVPGHEVCEDCHFDVIENEQCTLCHSAPKVAGRRPPPSGYVTVSHRKHVERTNGDCLKCHLALPEGGRAGAAPTMERCLGCHNHREDYAAGRCRHCHPDLTKFRIKPVSDFSHEGDFLRVHAQLGRSAAACAQCHDQTFCAGCHARTAPTRIEVVFPERVDRAFIHRNDWLGRHMIEAAADPALCHRCHGEDFCQSCHTTQNLTKINPDPRNPHPPGWLSPSSPNSHGRAARRDISSCASCHDRGPLTNCVECHTVGRIGGNPHPVGWTDRHDAAEIDRNAMCKYCHP